MANDGGGIVLVVVAIFLTLTRGRASSFLVA